MAEYSKLQPKRNYDCRGFKCRLRKKGYHPSSGVHRPVIAVRGYNEHLLLAALQSGFLSLADYSYPVLGWSFLEREYNAHYDYVYAIYSIELGMNALPLPKSPRVYPAELDDFGLSSVTAGHNVYVNGINCKLTKKGHVEDGFRESVFSVPYYNACLFIDNLNKGYVEIRRALYTVDSWQEVVTSVFYKKDGTPHHRSCRLFSVRMKFPGRILHGRKTHNILDSMLE